MVRDAALIALVIVGASAQAPIEEVPFCTRAAGERGEWTVVSGDTLAKISSRAGVDAARIAASNGVTARRGIRAGQVLAIDSRHLVADTSGAVVVVSLGQRRVFLTRGETVRSYPAAVGRSDWPTPVGSFIIVDREEDPTWDVPVSIQQEMRRQGKRVRTKVPPGPDNPLGHYWLRLSLGAVGIHGTNAPSSIYRYTTHGCVRLHPDDIAELFALVSTGDSGAVIYEPVLLGELEGRIVLEAHQDAYRRRPDPMHRVRATADGLCLTDRMDWAAVARVLAAASGELVDVTR